MKPLTLTLLALLAVCGVVGWRWGRHTNEYVVTVGWRELERVDSV